MKNQVTKIGVVLLILSSACKEVNKKKIFDSIDLSNSIFKKVDIEPIRFGNLDYNCFELQTASSGKVVFGYWGLNIDTLFFIPTRFSKECIVKYPIAFINDKVGDSHICEGLYNISYCENVPIIPTQYRITLISKESKDEDIIYSLKHSIYEITENSPNLNTNATIQLSLKKGVLSYEYNKTNGFNIPWCIPTNPLSINN